LCRLNPWKSFSTRGTEGCHHWTGVILYGEEKTIVYRGSKLRLSSP
jgi:hypothetical protein